MQLFKTVSFLTRKFKKYVQILFGPQRYGKLPIPSSLNPLEETHVQKSSWLSDVGCPELVEGVEWVAGLLAG
jgi:hypothetical protein